MVSSIRIEKNIPMKTRDGIILRSDIYRPDDNKKHPAILSRTPYGKHISTDTMMNLFETVQAGYARIYQDVRGRFASDGTYEQGDDPLLTIEGPDGYDAVEWIASQPWCDGNVGTAGGSHLGWLQWILAKENPPHLKAMAPWMCGTAPISEVTFLNGVVPLAVYSTLALILGIDFADKLAKQGKNVSLMRQMLNKFALNPDEVYNFLPLKDAPNFDFEGVKDIWNTRVLNAVPSPELVNKARWTYNKVTIPCCYISGWYDFFTRGTFMNFSNMKEKGGSQLARDSQHIFMGPWYHGVTGDQRGIVGSVNFGIHGNAQGAGLTEYNLAFFNKYLRGMDIQLPDIRYFVMGKNIWQSADAWPLPQTHWQRFFLHSQGKANTSQGNGLLNQDAPDSEPPDIFIYNPHFPVPSTGGTYSAASGLLPGPIDQSRIECREDILCYTTQQLQEAIEITGPLKLHLVASTSARDTDFMVRLCDVYPNGSSINIAEGLIRVRYRNSFQSEMVQPYEIIEYVIDLGNTSQLFSKNHKIRIAITSSNFPAFDRNMNTGNNVGVDAVGIPAMQTIYHDSSFTSYIDLPVIPMNK